MPRRPTTDNVSPSARLSVGCYALGVCVVVGRVVGSSEADLGSVAALAGLEWEWEWEWGEWEWECRGWVWGMVGAAMVEGMVVAAAQSCNTNGDEQLCAHYYRQRAAGASRLVNKCRHRILTISVVVLIYCSVIISSA